MPTFDGLKRRQVVADTFSGTDVQLAGSVTSAGPIVQNSRGLVQGNIGSPASTQNVYLQAGSAATGAGSDAWVAFPEGFNGANVVVNTSSWTPTADIRIEPGSINAGSFYALSIGAASADFGWTAIEVQA